jgi:predicted DNA-binding protein with PD1-like motif
MEYQIGQTGRVVAARLFEGDDIYACIEGLAQKEKIDAAAVFITGGIRKGSVVVGPKQETPKIEPDLHAFEGPGEVLGVGTLYPDDKGPKLHLHAAIGKREGPMVGCPRGKVTTFLILEVTMIELIGIKGMRSLDTETGFNLLRF